MREELTVFIEMEHKTVTARDRRQGGTDLVGTQSQFRRALEVTEHCNNMYVLNTDCTVTLNCG